MSVIENIEFSLFSFEFEAVVGGKLFNLLKESHEQGLRINRDDFIQAIEDDRSSETLKEVRQSIADGTSAEERDLVMELRDATLDGYAELARDYPSKSYSFKIKA
tara:strand:- start:247 stop:561 length:315 start_codon:yes stop_codon:yes gene_type:complete